MKYLVAIPISFGILIIGMVFALNTYTGQISKEDAKSACSLNCESYKNHVGHLMETLSVIFAMIALFLWVRSESNADRRQINQIQRQDRNDMIALIEAVRDDVKDFHRRLGAIEERNKGR